MFNKKTLILGAASALLASGLVGCGGGGSGAADLKYWCPSVDNDVMEKLVEEFVNSKEEYKGKNIVRDQNYGEGDAYAALHQDLENAADVMLMADDNIRSGVQAEEIASVDEDQAEFVKATGAEAVLSVSIDNKMYGYPYRADNSPLPIYDTTVFTKKDDLGSIESMLKACEAAGKKFYLDMGNGWYNSFMVWAGGAAFYADKDASGKDTIKNNIADHSTEIGEVLKTLKKLYNQYKTTWVSSSDNSAIEKGFKEGSIGVAFLWNDVAAIRAAGGSIGVTAWPSLTVGENKVDLKCFRSYKAVVVKEQEAGERLTLAKAFAKFLASKKAQEARLDLQYGPSNLELQATEAVKKLEFAGVIQKMADADRTVGQAISVTGDFWVPMQNVGTLIINGIEDGKAKAWGDYPSAKRAVEATLAGGSGWSNVG